jgi:propanol-preferring alcohol dehydrogenase
MSEIKAIDYGRLLFGERDLRSVTANTRADGTSFLRPSRTLSLAPRITDYPFDRVDDALDDLRSGNASGPIVISVG